MVTVNIGLIKTLSGNIYLTEKFSFYVGFIKEACYIDSSFFALMKYDQYISLIEKLDKYSAENPKAYEYKVFGLAVLGYGYFWLLILALMAVPLTLLVGLFIVPDRIFQFFLVIAKFWWAVIPAAVVYFGLLGSALKALTAKVPEPEGLEITKAQAPELFEFIYRTCDEIKSAKPTKVLITAEFNAAVVTLPRFGMFGRKTFLLLGLPLMRSLSPEQFVAVLAHELGHISEKHGSFAKWSYQIREMWGRLLESQEMNEQYLSTLYEGFVKWYFPVFSAYSFPLIREHEKQADRSASQIVGAKPLAESLILLEVTNRAMNDGFWQDLHRENVANHVPPEKIFGKMIDAIAAIDRDKSNLDLNKALTINTTYEDTHPALGDRLKLLGYWDGSSQVNLPEASAVSAMDKYLGNEVRVYIDEFEKNWSEHFAYEWEKRYEHFQTAQKRIDEIEQRLDSDDLTVDEMLEKAMLTADKEGMSSALPILRSALNKFPDSAAVRYNLGGVMLSLDDEDGLDQLTIAANMGHEYRLTSNQLAFDYLHSKGRSAEAAALAGSIDQEYEMLNAAQNERNTITTQDTFSHYEISEELAGKIRDKAKYYEEINSIYIAKKDVKYYPEQPFVVMLIETREKNMLRNRQDLDPNDILKIMAERFETENIHYFQLLTGAFKGFHTQLNSIEGSKIYTKI